MTESECNKCGARYPAAPAGHIHKCGRCSGGYCSPVLKGPMPAMTELDEAMVEKVARAIAEASGIEICADASYRHSTFGPKARAALTAILPDLREQCYAEERGRVVAWLRGRAAGCGRLADETEFKESRHDLQVMERARHEEANAIERGDHITKEGE